MRVCLILLGWQSLARLGSAFCLAGLLECPSCTLGEEDARRHERHAYLKHRCCQRSSLCPSWRRAWTARQLPTAVGADGSHFLRAGRAEGAFIGADVGHISRRKRSSAPLADRSHFERHGDLRSRKGPSRRVQLHGLKNQRLQRSLIYGVAFVEINGPNSITIEPCVEELLRIW
jgi:hypothetical protein